MKELTAYMLVMAIGIALAIGVAHYANILIPEVFQRATEVLLVQQ